LQIDLAHVRLLVLDEADKVLEAGKGFLEQVDVIFAACAKSANLSTSLFSATLPDWVEQVASSVLHSPTSIVVGAKNVSSLNVDQSLLFVGQARIPSAALAYTALPSAAAQQAALCTPRLCL
jgi:ATP-dependent RNA helicase DDX52/ROK1